MTQSAFRRPESVLLVVHDQSGNFLLLRRRDLGFWQSVTGSLDRDESDFRKAACRELGEETGLSVRPDTLRDWRTEYRFRILPELASRFAPGVTHNTEHLFSVCIDHERAIRLQPEEHDQWCWRDGNAALALTWSWSNRMGIRRLLADG